MYHAASDAISYAKKFDMHHSCKVHLQSTALQSSLKDRPKRTSSTNESKTVGRTDLPSEWNNAESGKLQYVHGLQDPALSSQLKTNANQSTATTFWINEISQALSKRSVCFRPGHRLALTRSFGRSLSVGTKTFKSTKEPPWASARLQSLINKAVTK